MQQDIVKGVEHAQSVDTCVACGKSATLLLFNSQDRLYGVTTRRFDVVRCAGCGLIRLHPKPSPEDLRTYYPKTYWFEPDSCGPSRLAQIYRRLVLRDHLSFLKNVAGPALDVGCGSGLLVGMLRERGINSIGIDISYAAASAAGRDGVPVICGTIEQAPFVPGSFQLITLYHVLEHVPDPLSYLRAAHALLGPRGRLVVQVPNASSWQARLLRERWTGYDVPRHVHTFRETHLLHLLESSGFEIAHRKHFSLRDNPASLASSIAPSLDPVARIVRGQHPPSLLSGLAYLSLILASLPFTFLEAACRKGSTVTIEAFRKP